ncbi:MAG: hypothetical protein FWF94_07045 [Oscillospiraceae bacterium]|nr:hypothetical protein [Oscillospiraceae bacterium]
MTVLYIIIAVLLFIGVLLFFSVIAYIDYGDDFSVKVKYLFITLYDSKKPKKQKKKKHKKRETNKNKKQKKSFAKKLSEGSGIDELAEDVKEGNKRGFDFEMYMLIYDAAKAPIKRLIQKLRVVNLRLNCVIGGDDAAKVALNYGLQSAAVSGGLAWLNQILKLKIKEVNVTADFAKEKTDIQMECRIKLRVISAVVFFIKYLANAAKK